MADIHAIYVSLSLLISGINTDRMIRPCSEKCVRAMQGNPVLVEIRFTVTTFAGAYGGPGVGVAEHVSCSTRHCHAIVPISTSELRTNIGLRTKEMPPLHDNVFYLQRGMSDKATVAIDCSAGCHWSETRKKFDVSRHYSRATWRFTRDRVRRIDCRFLLLVQHLSSSRQLLDRIGRTHWHRAAHHKSIMIPTAAASAYRCVA